MKSRRLVVLAVVALSFFVGRWSKSFTNVVVPGKTVRLVSAGRAVRTYYVNGNDLPSTNNRRGTKLNC